MHKAGTRYMFTTEGHVVSVDRHLREAPWKEFFPDEHGRAARTALHRPAAPDLKVFNSSSNVSCFSGVVLVWTERRRPSLTAQTGCLRFTEAVRGGVRAWEPRSGGQSLPAEGSMGRRSCDRPHSVTQRWGWGRSRGPGSR